jgi:hypothetical protein
VSTDIVSQLLNLPFEIVKDIIMTDAHTDLLLHRIPPSLECSHYGELGFTRYDGTRYLFLKNQKNLSPVQLGRLEELRSLNQNLNTVYILKDDLKHLWDCRKREEASRLLAQ